MFARFLLRLTCLLLLSGVLHEAMVLAELPIDQITLQTEVPAEGEDNPPSVAIPKLVPTTPVAIPKIALAKALAPQATPGIPGEPPKGRA
jgi:hypothetical protein